MTINLSPEQQQAYNRFIRARDKVKMVQTAQNANWPWIPHRDYIDSITPVGSNHPLFIQNDEWLEYKEASAAWWKIEPEHRKRRSSMINGDFGTQDSWDEKGSRVTDTYVKLKEQ